LEKLEAFYISDIKDGDYITLLEKYLKVADAEKKKPYLNVVFMGKARQAASGLRV
jgi:hypothetical protein